MTAAHPRTTFECECPPVYTPHLFSTRGHLYLKLDIILVKKFTELGLFFRTRQCTCVHCFGGVKMCKIGKKGCVFGHIDNFWKEHDGQIKKNTCKNMYLGCIFIPEKYVFRVCFESPFTRMISGPKYKSPPPPRIL